MFCSGASRGRGLLPAVLGLAALTSACTSSAPASTAAGGSAPAATRLGATPSAPAPSAPVPVPPAVSASATSRLSLDQSVAQLFDVGVSASAPSGARSLVRADLGGVFLHGRSTQGLALAPSLAGLQHAARTAGAVPLPHTLAHRR